MEGFSRVLALESPITAPPYEENSTQQTPTRGHYSLRSITAPRQREARPYSTRTYCCAAPCTHATVYAAVTRRPM